MKTLYLLLIGIVIVSCSNNASETKDATGSWLVNESEVTGQFNLFPLATNPEFTSPDNINLSDVVLVGILNFGNEIRVYPYVYVNQNEIINDVYNGQKFAFSYCPITRSAVAFKTNGIFRASGYLYRDNLTPWDEDTESIWSQMLLKGIRGPNKNIDFNTIPVLESTMGTVRDYLPTARVMVFQSFSNRASVPPDGNESDDENAPRNGDLVYGIFSDFSGVQIFNYKDFSTPQVLKLRIDSQDYVVYGDQSNHVISAFIVPDNDNFDLLANDFPYILEDSGGTKYDVFGKGSNGQVLQRPDKAYVAIWRAWDDFFDDFTFHN